MLKYLTMIIAFVILSSSVVLAEESDDTDTTQVDEAAETETDATDEKAKSGPRKMSGMSVLGNEEAPKSLVIIPWKSSELGDDISFSDTLDDRARPVDKEVFMRELDFYEIRSGE